MRIAYCEDEAAQAELVRAMIGQWAASRQTQKVAIARALYKDVPFIILDEPTAALDPLAEAEIYENFNALIQNKTAVYISHRMSSCKFCDRIVVLGGGRILEEGSHETLLANKGTYCELYSAQEAYYKK